MAQPESADSRVESEREPKRSARHFRLAAVLVLTGLACVMLTALVFYLCRPGSAPPGKDRARHLPPDPRLEYQGPFLNVDPAVKYVGSAECGRCHGTIAAAYEHHPMARTLIPIEDLAPAQPYDRSHRNPFVAFNSLFEVVPTKEHIWHRQTAPADGKPVYHFESEVHYAIGSGSHGHSYLSNRAGYLFQTPVSWFSQKQIWDQSPGFSTDTLSGRPIGGACLFCHSNRAQSLDNQRNHYASPIFPTGYGIGCERCHGPGAKHVAQPGSFVPLGADDELIDPTIVHPGKLKKLDPELCASICRQCHLTGEQRIVRHGRSLYDYRPGLRLDSFLSIFVRAHKPNEAWHAVNHVEQMYLSKCFQGSAGAHKLGCISCHDPHEHVGPARRVTFYRQRCLNCHQDASETSQSPTRLPAPARTHGCSLPLARRQSDNGNSCIACHMARYLAADIVHNASTDHRILARPAKQENSAQESAGGGGLVPFPKGAVDPKDQELSRDLALALAGSRPSRETAEQVVPILEITLQADPDDIDAWERKGMAFLMAGSQREALAAFQTAVAKDPQREISMHLAATTAYDVGERELALSLFRRARDLNPWYPAYRMGLANVLADKSEWQEAARECGQWLKLQPANVGGRKLLIQCLLHTAQNSEAQAELNRIKALEPKNAEMLEKWFAAERRTVPGK